MDGGRTASSNKRFGIRPISKFLLAGLQLQPVFTVHTVLKNGHVGNMWQGYRSLQPFTNALSHTNRADVIGMNEADQVRPLQFDERIPQASFCRLSGIAPAPIISPESPADFKVRPTFGLPWAD